MSGLDTVVLRNNVVEALHQIYDPEIPINIYDLGLIYDVDVKAEGDTPQRYPFPPTW